MGVRDYWVPESFIHALGKDIKGFNNLSQPYQAKMAFYIWIAGTSRRRHKKEEGCMSIGYMDLEKAFGRSGFNEINNALNIFEVTKNWWWSRNLTRAYKLTEPVQAVKDKYLARVKQNITRLITLDGQVMRTLPSAIASKDLDGVTATAWKEAKPFNSIPVDLDKLREFHQYLEHTPIKERGDLFIDAEADDDITYMYEILGQLIRLAHTDVAGRGSISHRYAEGKTGRLYARGISLQTAPRSIRKAALHGLYDYDFENCHYAIFSQLAARYNYECGEIKHYLAHKNEIREGIAKSIGITKDEAKMCLLALMFGARLNEWSGNAIPKAIGSSRSTALFNDARFKAIADDVLEGRKIILKNWPKRRTTILNDMGKAISIKGQANVRLAHLIQGIEAKALRTAINLYPDEVVLLMHDGFVSKRALDVELIEKAVYTDTSIKLEMSGSIIALPTDLDFGAQCDTKKPKCKDRYQPYTAKSVEIFSGHNVS